MKVKENYDYSIALIRLIATLCIIICHTMEYLDIELACWFNVGVQIFLCMSGFLYGQREKISDDLTFYKKNFIKILVDYYVVIIPVILLFIIFIPEQISIVTTINVLLTYRTLNGGRHLWYIAYCLFCYLITPFLFRYFEKSKHVIRHFLLLSILAIAIMETFLKCFKPALIFCYILGFFLGNILYCKKFKLFRNLSLLIVVGAIISNSIQIIQDYVLKLELNGIIASLYGRFCNYAHVLLGVALFIVLKFVFSIVFKTGYPNAIKKICFYSNKYSYDIYLVHFFVILGPFSLMEFTKSIGLNITLIMVIILVGAVVVNFVSSQIKSRIEANWWHFADERIQGLRVISNNLTQIGRLYLCVYVYERNIKAVSYMKNTW